MQRAAVDPEQQRCGHVLAASAGSTSQARSGVPSSAVAVTSVSVPGSVEASTGAEQALRLLVGRPASSRTGAGGASTAERSA